MTPRKFSRIMTIASIVIGALSIILFTIFFILALTKAKGLEGEAFEAVKQVWGKRMVLGGIVPQFVMFLTCILAMVSYAFDDRFKGDRIFAIKLIMVFVPMLLGSLMCILMLFSF